MSATTDVKLHDFPNIFSLHGKVAVVTGGSRGLGLHAASGLAQAGCTKIFITSRKASACAAACAALNALPHTTCTAIPIAADLSRPGEVARLVAAVARHTDRVDVLLANAGASWGEAFDSHPGDAFRKVLALNVQAVFECCQGFAPLLRRAADGGEPARIVVTGSIAGIGIGTLGAHATFGYSASKAAVLHLARNLALELGPQGILVNSIAPGFFPSKMASGLMELSGGVEELAKQSPNRRLGRPEDIAAAVVFLCSRGGSHMNGGTLVLDGGSVLQAKL